MTYNPRLLTPPKEEEEVYPYRRVWRSVALESGIIFAAAALFYALTDIFDFHFPEVLHLPLGVVLAVMPLSVWLVFSLWAERFVPQPRRRLLPVVIISALVANAVGIPLINDFLQVNRWLPLSNALNRIAGYSFTVGVVEQMLKYLVIRYMVWPDLFRTRWDGVAYGAASAVGYATMVNLHVVFTSAPLPQTAAARVFDTLVLHLVTGVLLGYGLSELRFSLPSPFLLPTTVAFAAFITGVAIPVQSGLRNASLVLGVSTTRPLFGLVFSGVLLVSVLLALAFLFNAAERRARESLAEEEA